ncbi:MAG: M20 family metallopeptidase [bacterium]|nr:M20 family metallopeptidase [bacterium]
MKSKIEEIVREKEAELIQIRRSLHQCPELALQEVETSRLIAENLKKIPGVTVYDHMAEGTGVVGILEGKKGPGKCVMLRADIDALPIEEQVDTEFKSKNPGKMHACGHDAHATWIIGAAMILSQLRDEFCGTVKFVFQPGEECGKGAKALIEKDKILENPKVDAAFAAHAWPTVRAGKIGIAEKYAFGCPGGFTIKIIGKGGHGSWPYECINPITIAVQICSALQAIVAEKIDSVEPRVISIGSIHAGDAGNIIPDECVVSGTFRATEMAIMKQIATQIENVVAGITAMHGAQYELDVHIGGEAVINDPKMLALSKKSAEEILGEGNCYIIDRKHLGGENFAEYSSRVPGCYMFVGIATDRTEGKFGLHSPIFEIAEEVLAPASAVFANIVLNYFEGTEVKKCLS